MDNAAIFTVFKIELPIRCSAKEGCTNTPDFFVSCGYHTGAIGVCSQCLANQMPDLSGNCCRIIPIKWQLVSVKEFIDNGGVLEPGRELYNINGHCGYFRRYEQGSVLMFHSKFDMEIYAAEGLYSVKIPCLPIYK